MVHSTDWCEAARRGEFTAGLPAFLDSPLDPLRLSRPAGAFGHDAFVLSMNPCTYLSLPAHTPWVLLAYVPRAVGAFWVLDF